MASCVCFAPTPFVIYVHWMRCGYVCICISCKCTIETTILYFASLHLYMLYGRCLMFYCFSSSARGVLRILPHRLIRDIPGRSVYIVCACAARTVYLNLAKLHPVIMRILIVRSWRSYPEARANSHTFHFMVILLPRPYTLLLVRVARNRRSRFIVYMRWIRWQYVYYSRSPERRFVLFAAYSGSEFIIHNLWYGRLLLVGRQIGMTIDWIVCNDPSRAITT